MIHTTDAGESIYYEIEGKGNHTIIFFHGLFGSSEQKILKSIRTALNEEFRTLSFDYMAHGKSSGQITKFSIRQLLKDSKDILTLVCGKEQYSFIGFSLGAYPSILLAKDNKNLRSLFLINPATHMPSLMFNSRTNKNMSKYTDKHNNVPLVTKLKVFLELLRYDLYKDAEQVRSPVFLFHSIDDDIVPFVQSMRLKQHVRTKKQFIFLHGENHPCEEGNLMQKQIIPKYKKFLRSLSV